MKSSDMSVAEARAEIREYSHKLAQSGLVCATDGNLSVRLDEDRVLITPSGVPKGEVTDQDPIVVDMDGVLVSGAGKPSSEGKLHLAVLRLRPDVNAVIHAHPPICIAYTVAGIPIDTFLLPEVVVTLGSLPTSPYATPTTREVPDSIRDYIQHSDAVMLARHGAVTVGGTLGDAFKILEKMEASARIGLYARLLGGAVPFSPEETAKLLGLRPGWGVERRTASPTDFTSVRLSTSAPEPDDLPRPNDRLVTGMSERRLRAVIEEAVRAALRGEVDPDRPRAP